MVGQQLPQINENCYSVLQCPMWHFLPLFYGSKHSQCMYWTFFTVTLACSPYHNPFAQRSLRSMFLQKEKTRMRTLPASIPDRLGAKLASQTNTRLPVLRRTERQAYKPRKDWCLMLGGLTKATVCSFFMRANCKLTNRRVTEIPRHAEHCLPLPS